MALENNFNGGNDDFIIDESQVDFSFENPGLQEIDEHKEDTSDKDDKDLEDGEVNESENSEEDDEYKDVDKDDLFANGFNQDSDEEDEEDDSDEDETSDDEDESKDSSEKPKSKGKKTSGIVSVFKMLKDKGIIELNEDDEAELDDNTASDMIEDSFDRAVDNKLAEMISGLEPERKELIKFISGGGDLSKLSLTVGNKISAVDIDKESDQIKILKNHLISTEFGDEDEIDAQIQFYKDRGILDKQAKKIYKNTESKEQQKRQEILQQQEQERAKTKENQRKYRGTLIKTLEENSEIGDITFSRKDKDLPNYINEASIQLENSEKKITPFYKDLYAAMQDPKKTLVLAKILRSNFDFSSIKNSAISKQTKDIKDNIERTKDKKSSAKKSSQPVRLADLLDN